MTENDQQGDYEDFMDDDSLLETVTKSQLQELCQQLDLSTKGTKEEMLQRLRKHADEQAELETQRRRERAVRVEEGGNVESKERYELVDGDNHFEHAFQEDDEEDHGYFFFEVPTTKTAAATSSNETSTETTTSTQAKTSSSQSAKKQETNPKKSGYISQSEVIAAPPPPDKVNENGERVVTVYSSTDQNDLTGVAAAQPGQAALSGTDAMSAGSGGSSSQPQPWDMEKGQTKAATSKEIEEAKEKVTELVQTLLAMSGAPAFRDYDMDDELDDIANGSSEEDDNYVSSSESGYKNRNSPVGFVGFDPSKVPTHILTEASQALRANRGQVLQDVLREFELRAIGQDGMKGDNIEDGGGHFKEVAKVRAFLEGYRRAEVRKSARVTVTFLLDKLVSEGIEGLDMTLATMSRSSDDSASMDDAYELNDSLLSYLNDVIRQQEKKVDRLRSSESGGSTSLATSDDSSALEEGDPINSLWNRAVDEDGEVIESLDPNDKRVQQALKEELEKSERDNGLMTQIIPESAPEKLLLLLTLLRERIKTEAAFPNDERSRNLRLLAYCLHCRNAADREELVLKDIGRSIDVSLIVLLSFYFVVCLLEVPWP